MRQEVLSLQRSETVRMHRKLLQVLPSGVFKKSNGLPVVIAEGRGARLTDVDGNAYLDYCGAWGALIHGHAAPRLVQAALDQMHKGSLYGVVSAVEEPLATLLVRLIDGLEKLAFVSSDTEAAMLAVWLARRFTKRRLIVQLSKVLTESGDGVISLPYNDLRAIRELLDAGEVAAVILEPLAMSMEFLAALRAETERVGALLIFDETTTGFRVALRGSQELYGVLPDLFCFGKVLGGGLPLAAVGGRAEVMDGYQPNLLLGNPVALAVGFEAVQMCTEPGFYRELQRKTDLLTLPLKERIAACGASMHIQQVGSMVTFTFANELEQFADFYDFLLQHGIYAPPVLQQAWFVSAAHSDADMEYTRDVLLEFLDYTR